MELKLLIALLTSIFATSPVLASELNAESTVGSFVQSNTVQVNTQKISGFLDQISTLEALPRLKFEVQTPAEIQAGIPKSFKDSFDRVRLAVLNKSAAFGMYIGDGSQGPATCDIANQRIGVSVDLINSILGKSDNPNAVLDFILAHEISHYLVELYIQNYAQDHLSPSGLPSRIVFTLPRAFSPKDPALKLINDEAKVVGAAASTHAEVDAFAALILARMGYSKQTIKTAFIEGLGLDGKLTLKIKDMSPKTQGNGVQVSASTMMSDLFEFESKDFFEQLGVIYSLEPMVRATSVLPMLVN